MPHRTTSDRISIVAKLFVSHSGIETGRSGPHSSSVAGSSSSVARVPRPRCQTGPNSARMSASESACCRAIEAQAHPCHAAAAERNAAPTRPSAPPPQPPRPPVFWQLQPWPQHSNEPRYPQWSLPNSPQFKDALRTSGFFGTIVPCKTQQLRLSPSPGRRAGHGSLRRR